MIDGVEQQSTLKNCSMNVIPPQPSMNNFRAEFFFLSDINAANMMTTYESPPLL